MDILQIAIVVFGLALFEIISSIDNAIINAQVLRTMPERYRRIFLVYGIFFAVVVVRGLLPFIIIWVANPLLSFPEMLRVAFSSEAEIEQALHTSKPLLLLGGGIYLVLVFLGWLFMEEKKYAFFVEHFVHKQSVWFYAISSCFITLMVYFALREDPFLALAASVGTTAFFITDGFKQNAERKEKELISSSMGAWSKILYLEVLDASFSIDGVIGAFAFTLSIPLILLGNGIGAVVVREVTVRGINFIGRFAYLKNGAMYSVGSLGALMVLESFGKDYPFWLAPLNTAVILGIFFFLSWREIRTASLAS